MATLRLTLAESPEGRTASADKDSLLINAYREKGPDGIEHVVKRAGLDLFTSATGTFGNGIYRNWSVVDDQIILEQYFYAWGASPAWYGEGIAYTRPFGSRAIAQGDGYSHILSGNVTAPAFGVDADGNYLCWGGSAFRRFSVATPYSSSVPYTAGTVTPTISQLLGGHESPYILKADGSLWVSERIGVRYRQGTYNSSFGAIILDDGVNVLPGVLDPVAVQTKRGATVSIDNDWAYASSYGYPLQSLIQHSFMIKTDGSLWGTDYDTTDDVVVLLDDTQEWLRCETYVDTKQRFIGVKTDGTVWTGTCDGHDPAGFLASLTQDATIAGVKEYSIRSDVTSWPTTSITHFALKTDGTLWTKGKNEFGECGLGTQTVVTSWTQVMPGTTFVSMCKTGFSGVMYAKDSGGVLWVWGYQQPSVSTYARTQQAILTESGYMCCNDAQNDYPVCWMTSSSNYDMWYYRIVGDSWVYLGGATLTRYNSSQGRGYAPFPSTIILEHQFDIYRIYYLNGSELKYLEIRETDNLGYFQPRYFIDDNSQYVYLSAASGASPYLYRISFQSGAILTRLIAAYAYESLCEIGGVLYAARLTSKIIDCYNASDLTFIETLPEVDTPGMDNIGFLQQSDLTGGLIAISVTGYSSAARWNGSTWEMLAQNTPPYLYLTHDANPQLLWGQSGTPYYNDITETWKAAGAITGYEKQFVTTEPTFIGGSPLGTTTAANPTPISFLRGWNVYDISSTTFLGHQKETLDVVDGPFQFQDMPDVAGSSVFLLKSKSKLYYLTE